MTNLITKTLMIKKSISWYLGIFLLVFSLSSCEKLEEILPQETQNSNAEQYVIKKGQHYSTHSLSKIDKETLNFKTTFDSSAIYTALDETNQADINKLYGVSDCNSTHQENSARFGWRWMDNNLEILAYTYVNGKRNFQYITSVALNKEYTYSLTLAPEQYIFSVGKVTVTMERHCTGKASGYKLYPYFGGDETAPHDITILIEELQ